MAYPHPINMVAKTIFAIKIRRGVGWGCSITATGTGTMVCVGWIGLGLGSSARHKGHFGR